MRSVKPCQLVRDDISNRGTLTDW